MHVFTILVKLDQHYSTAIMIHQENRTIVPDIQSRLDLRSHTNAHCKYTGIKTIK